LATTEGSQPKCKKEYKKKCALFRIEAGAEKCLADATKRRLLTQSRVMRVAQCCNKTSYISYLIS